MLIFIRALAGTVIRLNVSPCESVHTVKTRISQLKGIQVNQQHLIFDGEELPNHTTLMNAHISHGALLRLVIGVHSGPISYEAVNPQRTTHSYHRLSSTPQVICSLTVPVDPVNRIPASTVVLPVLCPFNRVPPNESEHSKNNSYHPTPQYGVSQTGSTFYPNQATFYYSPTTEWEESLSHIPGEFPMDEETVFGSNEEATSEMAEYMGYAINEDELSLVSGSFTSGCIEKLSENTSGPVSVDNNPCTQLKNRPNNGSNPSVSGCHLVPIYPIHPDMQWIVAPTGLELSERTEANDPNQSATNSVSHFTPFPVALGIPVPIPTPTSIQEQLDKGEMEGTRILWTSSHSLDHMGQQFTHYSALPTLPRVFPGHLPRLQSSNSIPDQNPLLTPQSVKGETNVSGLVIPPFTLLPVSQLGTLATDDSSNFDQQSLDLTPNLINVDNNTMTVKPVDSAKQLAIANMHSNPKHILESEKECTRNSDEEEPNCQFTNCVVKMRCFACHRRTRLAQGFSCRCQKWFCQKHYHPEDHNCAFDFKSMRLLSKTNATHPAVSPQLMGVSKSKPDSA